MVIKFNSDIEVEWARSIDGSGQDIVTSVAETNDGDYLVGGRFSSSNIIVGNYILTNNANNSLDNNGFIIEYNAEGKVEWAKSVGENDTDDSINSVTEINDGSVVAVGYSTGKQQETDQGHILVFPDSGLMLKIVNQIGVPEVQELTVENSRKVFNITTDVNEIDGVKGGSISGEDKNPYEAVKYGDNSTKEIKMIPDEDYKIIEILVNGKEYPFTENADGTYTMPQFENVTEDKHVEVTYSKIDNTVIVNKVDSETKEPLEGITFKLDQIEERTEPEGVIGSLTDNGEAYTLIDMSNEITDVLGELTDNGTYTFVEEEGKYVPTNSKTYQTANGGTAGIGNSTANSYIKIDLSGKKGKYLVVVNAEVSSQYYNDYGYATITKSTTAPTYSSSTGRFIYISGTISEKDYTSTIKLEGDNIYYLHLGYRKSSSTDTGDDRIVFNSIKVYGTTSTTYNFVANGQGGYESNNQGHASTVANSYIPINLKDLTGKYNLTVNANVSSASGDYGYATVTSSTTAPSYSSSTGRFIYISGTSGTASEPTDYTTVLQGGSMYYLHLGYYKNSTTDSGDDKFTVNSVKLTLNDSELYHTEVTTNSQGQAITQIPFGKYQVTEVNTPEGYESIEPQIIEFRENGTHEFTIENSQLQRVIVHHYLKNDEGEYTHTKVAEDEVLMGKVGEEYETAPHLDLDRYELEKDEEENYVIPENANGTYDDNSSVDQEVIYYYEIKDYPLIVHHYIEGTADSVPLKDGSLAEDEEYTGKEGESYTTEAIEESELDEKYELVEVPTNATGNYIVGETIVTYYYKVAERPLTIIKTGVDESPLPGVTFEIKTKDTETIVGTYETNNQGKINIELKVGEYLITETGVPEGYKIPDNPTQTINITKDQASYEINIQNEKIPAQVIVHHYIEGTEEKVPSKEGGVVEDEIKTGVVGDIYASKVSDKIQINCEYVSSTNNTSGTMTEEPIEVIYYYKIKDAGIEQTIDKIGTDKITNEDQKVEYTITYTGNVTEYVGKATVLITDTLPYEIDEARSSLDGGLYNDAQKTITWTIDVNNIDTYINETSGNISITKQISLAYENMDYSKTSFENKVQGSIYLALTKQEKQTNEDKVETQTEFKTNVTVTKVWNHTNNIYRIPTQVEVQVKNGAEVVARQIINSSNKVGEDDNTWSYTFTGLPKYDEEGLLINYTVDESEVNSGDLDYYDTNIDGNTITNTYDGPIISAVKESTTADEERGYVLEGETITYTITVTNDGGRDKVVTVQDTVPAGTTFVEDSIKVNGSGSDNYTEAKLNSGIQVNVPAKVGETAGTATVSFDVTVNQLEGEDLEALTKVLTNTAVVDGKETNPVTDIVNKADVKFNKTSNPEAGSEQSPTKVTAGDKITYTINLSNEGTAPETTVVKDSAPAGTTFAGNIVVKINNVAVEDATYDETDLRDGIPVTVPAKEGENAGTSSVSFDVTVNDLSDNTEIKNQATVGEGEEPNTNEVKHLYVEPEITSEKTAEIYNAIGTKVTNRTYALEGEIIKYTITVTNNGGLSKDVEIKDTIPEGTTFVDGSIEVVNAKEEKEYTQADLNNGIEVNVPEKVGQEVGTAVVSFEVRVNTLEGVFTKVIENTAQVDENPTDKVEVTVNKPNVIAHKESTPANGENVKVGDKIIYRIVLDNTQGTAPGTVKVQDTVPTGTTYEENSLKLNSEPIGNEDKDLENGIRVTVPAGETSIVEFTVTVNDLNNGDTITNIAKVDDTPIEEEITHHYIEPIISGEKTAEIINKEGTKVTDRTYALEGETIRYTITVKNDGGLEGDAIVKDEAPEGTTFVGGSIEVVNAKEEKDYAEADLNNGIEVNVPAKSENVAGTSSVSFEVTVNELTGDVYQDTITNTAKVNEEDTTEVTTEVKKPHIVINKTSDPANGTEVTKEDEITYYIYVNNDGEAPETVTVKDSIPVGTTYKEGSIEVEGSQEIYELADLTTKGIEVELNPGEDKTVEFTVTVNDLDNGTDITNIATVQEPGKEEEQTDPVVHNYVEAIINASKAVTIENPTAGYAKEDETITYTITITNTGDLGKTVKVKDTIPVGTSFVEGSIKVDDEETEYTQTDLQNGIDVEVPERTSEEQAGTVAVTFEVTVNELTESVYEGTITNKANVDGEDTNEVQTEVKKAHITGEKTSTPANGSTVVNGQEITYTITLTNEGTAPDTVTVRDEIPDGTTYEEGSIKVQGDSKVYGIEDLTINGIDVNVPSGETRTVEFKVTANDLNNGDKIRNIAYVEGEATNTVEHTYIEPIIEGSKTAETANGLDYVVERETITYTITATNTGDLDKDIQISDEIPEGTTFVGGSIKVNNVETGNTEENLREGIGVNVPAKTELGAGTASVSFQVTVNPLEDGELIKQIRNTAVVDNEETEEVTETVNKSDVTYNKTSIPASGSTVKAGDEITYIINLANNGTAPATVEVKDNIPDGTAFVEGSIRVNNQDLGKTLEDLTTNGIEVGLPAKEGEEASTGSVSFTVTVNDIEDGQEIRNVATVDDNETNEIVHTYVEPIIDQTKSAITEHSLDYVVEGEKITYTITVTNDGGLSKDVIVKDTVPEGTTFVDESIKVNGIPVAENNTEDNLRDGITVNVPAKTEEAAGTSTVSFEVTVNPLEGADLANLSKEITNTATVDDNETNEVTETVNKADVKASKSSIPASGTEVKLNDEITYIITLDNSRGTAPTEVTVKDTIPSGTTFVEGSIKVKEQATSRTSEELANGIKVDLDAGESTTVEFKVTVNDLDNGTKIENTATVNDTPTNKTEHTYIEPIISAEKTATTEHGLGYVVEGEKITYTITVTNNGGLSKDVTIKDEVPEGTTFVEGSIKVNSEETVNTGANLEEGIKVNVPKQGKTTITFEVTVDELTANTYEYIIRNTAQVDEKETNEVETIVNKANIKYEKVSSPASGETVENGQEITYTINLRNEGTAPDTVRVKDSIPEGTEFVEESIKVGGEARTELTKEDLTTNGIEVLLNVEESKTVEFKVKVVDNNTLENGDKIINTATVNDKPTNAVEHTYIEPIISASKTQKTENSLDYVVEGEKITYTITISNTGDLGKDVVVRDNIPEGTSFVEGSIKVNNAETEDTETNLEEGITVNVPKQGETIVSFQVTVDKLLEGQYESEIVNAAVVDEKTTNDVRIEVHKPNVIPSKTADPTSGTEITAGDEITYTITLDNTLGTAPTSVSVTDEIPAGTTFVSGSIKVGGESRAELTQDNLTSGISVDISEGETTTVEFKVTVNDINNGDKITNIAYADDKETEEVEHTYIEPIISAEKSAETENGLGYVVEGEVVTYTITVTNSGDLGKEVTVVDSIPEGTSFVEDSIKVNGEGRSDLGQEDLERGIQEYVNANDEVTVSFEVTVDLLEDGSFYKEIENTATVDGNPTDPVTEIVNKADVKGEKSSIPASGETVEKDDEITYIINVSNDGTAPSTAVVKDSIPAGTTFIEGSIKVKGQSTSKKSEELASGIEVNLDAEENTTVEFKVKVSDLDNGDKIENIAIVNDTQTNKTEHTYVEPIIAGEKAIETENGLDYVVEGEVITYRITATNSGDAAGTIKVSDDIPEGTTFVDNSIKVANKETGYTAEELTEGIDVEVEARRKTEVEFQVRVNNLAGGVYEDTIENTAIVDGNNTNEVTEEVHKPNVVPSKTSTPASGEEVTAGDEITYTITLDNSTGTAPGEVTVKDEIPEGTTFVEGSIKVQESEATYTMSDLSIDGIKVEVPEGETRTVEFKVTVNDNENGTEIRNVATMEDENGEETPTEEVTHKYVEPIISAEKAATTEKGLDYVVEGEIITYTITISNTGDLSKDVVVRDNIPEGTSFVEGSVKVNNADTENTEDNLAEGITVNVPKQGKTTITFEVTVNNLVDVYERTVTNKATVDEKETNEVTEEVKKAHVRIEKTSNPATGEKVTLGDEITYTISLNNEGTAPSRLVVTDRIPEGTSYVEGSIKVNSADLGHTLSDLTTNGIEVTVPAGETVTVEFKVTVNDLDNGDTIVNKASIRNPETEETKETNEVTHEYVEAVIEAEKEMTTEKGLSYVIPGEKVTYTIRVRNTGDLSKKLIVSDNIPEGTEFANESVLLNGEESNITKEQLETGFEIEVGGKEEVTISFSVTVKENATEIKNKAVVDGKETNETKVSVISYEKRAEVIRKTEEEIADGSVTAGDKIKYTIRVNNLGEENVENIVVKDVVPEGTTLSKINNSGVVNDKKEITWTIANIAGNGYAEVSFEVSVDYDVADNKTIANIATVDGEETNETETSYDKPEIKEESTIEKTGTEIINSTEDSVTYKVTYNANIKDFIGEGKVTIIDYLPYAINVEEQYLDGGKYDAETKTITWEEDLSSIDTYTNGEKTITIEKEITVKYEYGEDAETLEGTLVNRVEGKLELTQENPDKPGENVVVKEDTVEDTHETKVQIPTHIIVHHYIEGTTTKVPSKVYGEVVEDERTDGYVGEDYTTSASSNVQENYKVVSNSGNTNGTMTRTPIEIIYYYKLQPGDITKNTIEKSGTDKIVNKDDEVSYEVTYTGKVENYVGNAKVEIIDYLPYAIDEAVSDLNGGLYNSENNTITWLEDLGRVNTYTEGAKEITITKNIEVVFTEMNFEETSFTNRAQGKIILEETKQEQDTPETSKETQTEFVKDVTVEKVWDDNNDIKGRRPESVTVQLTANGNTTYKDEELEKVVLNQENNWTYTFSDLPKYTEQGQEIAYSVIEVETNEGDLEYYEAPDIEVFNSDSLVTVRVTNSYKLMDTNLDANIEKTGTELTTSSKDEVNYNIKYNATVKDYIGESLVTITDYLPYSIDENLSELDGGTYDSLTNTITWTENIEHINTYENGDYKVSLEKNITVVFTNLDATVRTMTNRVTGKIDLYETEKTNTVEDTYETKVEIPGKVIVKYVDKESSKEIAEGNELNGLAGDSYSTEQKDIYGYTFVEDTKNTSGNMIEGTIEVIYYYERTNAGGVIVHYVDEEGNKLTDDEVISGKVADTYKTEQKDIPNYDFVRVEGQTEGELVEGTIEVTYIYKKIPAKVIVQYLEKDETPDDDTDNVVLAEQEIIEGFSGDSYSTEIKEIENYKLSGEIPSNAEGTMTREDIYVIYYYERKPSGIVTVKYVDVDTNEEILYKVETEDGEEYTSYREQMSGLCGLEYVTEQKDIPYYNFVEEMKPTNATGIYTEEDIEVIYYYRKQEFNLSVEKQIDRITVNGVEHSLKEDLNQIDVVASKVQETDIVVTYKIIVRNPSEIAGTAKVIENIPDFFRTAEGTSSEWTENGKTLEAKVELNPGETKELLVVLRWIRNSNNFGLQVNTVTLQNITNLANYEEKDLGDNTATAEVIFSVKTGGVDTAIIIGTTLVVMLGALIFTVYLKEKARK